MLKSLQGKRKAVDRPEELPETAQRGGHHTGNFWRLLLLFFVSFKVGVKGILPVAAAIDSFVIFCRLYAHFFSRYRRILFVYLTFTLSIFSLFLFIISFCFSPFCLRFPVYLCIFNALITVFSLTVFTAFRYRVPSRRSRTTLVSIVYLWLVISVFFILFVYNSPFNALRVFHRILSFELYIS